MNARIPRTIKIYGSCLVSFPTLELRLALRMSSSPLPSLSDLVSNITQESLRSSPTASSSRITSAYFSGSTILSGSRKLAQVESTSSSELLESVGVSDTFIDCRSLDDYVKSDEKIHLEKCSKTVNQPSTTLFKEEHVKVGTPRDKTEILNIDVPKRSINKVTWSKEAEVKIAEDVGGVSNVIHRDNLDGTESSKQKHTQKRGSSKVNKTTQSTLRKGRVTKPLAPLTSASKSKETIGFAENLSKKSEDDDVIHSAKPQLEWKPSMDDEEVNFIPVRDNVIDNSISYNGTLNMDHNKKETNNLFKKFAYSKSTKSTNEKRKSKEKVIGKRKLIELVKCTTSVPEKIKGKEKAHKKKARTLTELSTSLYEEEQEPQSLIKSLQTEGNEEDLTKLKFSASLGSEASNKMKSITIQTPKPILLSPESALRLVSKQDFVFGTSSQLAREESPTLLRDLQKPMPTSDHLSNPFSSSPVPLSTIKSKKSIQNLWNAGSRDSDGRLLNIELVDLAISPNRLGVIDSSPILAGDPPLEKESSYKKNSTSLTQHNSNHPIVICEEYQGNHDDLLVLSCSPQIENNQSQEIVKHRPNLKKQTSTQRAADEVPNYESYTTAQLAKEISAYHFKPVKKREQMINLLQKCWAGKQEMKTKTSNTNKSINVTEISVGACSSELCETISPKKTTREEQKHDTKISSPKLRKESSKKMALEGYSNLTSHTGTPKKSRKKSKIMNLVAEVEVEVEAETMRCKACSPSSELSPTSTRHLLFSHITQAIKNTAPSKEAKNPNWYEKILLYDPIVIEDLTIWLNTGALQKTNWDGEVDPKVVKKWCESKSICCLWRENLRGGARNRY